MRRRSVSLGILIASAITLAMLVLASVLVFQGYRGMSSGLVSAASQSTRQLSTTLNDRLKAATEPTRSALRILAHDPLTRASSLPERQARLPVLAETLRTNELVTAAYVGYPNGDFFLLREAATATLQERFNAPPNARFLLQTVTQNGETVGEWHFFNANLERLTRQAKPDYRFDPRTRGWFSQATVSEDTILAGPYVFFTTRDIGITLARQSATNRAVVGLDVTLSDLSQQLTGLKLTPGTQMAVVDGTRTVIAHPELHRLMAANDNDGLARLPDLTSPALAGIPEQTLRTSQPQPFRANGQDWFGMIVPLSDLGTDKLSLRLAIPSQELLAGAWQVVRGQALIAAAILIVLLLLGWFLGRRIGQPLKHLAGQVDELAHFRFDTGIDTSSRIREAGELARALSSMANTIRGFQRLALTLNREQRLDVMLQGVLEQLIRVLGRHSGAIYLLDRKTHVLNRAAECQAGHHPEQLDPVDTTTDDETLVDRLRSELGEQSVFSILRDRENHLLGALVIDLTPDDETLDRDLITFVSEVAGSAAVAIETRQLIQSQRDLLDGVIHLVADAIDAKSPYTSGHCERVPQLAEMIIDSARHQTGGDFADFHMNDSEAYEFHIAAWLHDCGKITSPEYVVDKATKLETIHNRIHEIRTRFEVLHRDSHIRYLQARLKGEPEAAAREIRDREQAALQRDFRVIAETNLGGEALEDETIATIHRIGDRTWLRHFSDRIGLSQEEERRLPDMPEPHGPVVERLLDDKPQHLVPWGDRVPPVRPDDPHNRWGFDMALPPYSYHFGERYNLTIPRGTLTPEERFHINDHIVQTIRLLDNLPLPEHLSRVPRLAGTHHERMDGEGYPYRLHGSAMTIPEKAMAVADVFEALTAVDRPYKRGKTLSEALGIMAKMVWEGHLDGTVFRLFLEGGIYRQYGERFLHADQQDDVNHDDLLSRAGFSDQAPTR
ncbi:HD domain-containing phosphohydrolase [Tamilnaduibacter salinus]|nr:HD domain-containing phosphohydrolase [Tamilnaduibacter salinus]